jgi:hypothetical protein
VKYLLLIYGNDEVWDSYSKAEFDQLIAAVAEFQREIRESGELIGVEGLSDPVNAKVVRVRGGAPVVTDGPYLESKEYLASFLVVDVDSEQRALELAAGYPAADRATLEVWPLLQPGGTEM